MSGARRRPIRSAAGLAGRGATALGGGALGGKPDGPGRGVGGRCCGRRPSSPRQRGDHGVAICAEGSGPLRSVPRLAKGSWPDRTALGWGTPPGIPPGPASQRRLLATATNNVGSGRRLSDVKGSGQGTGADAKDRRAADTTIETTDGLLVVARERSTAVVEPGHECKCLLQASRLPAGSQLFLNS